MIETFKTYHKKALAFYSLAKRIKDGLDIPMPPTDVLTSGMEKSDVSGLYLPPNDETPGYLTYTNFSNFVVQNWSSYNIKFTTSWPYDPKPIQPDSEEFEVNMVEALMGWREWYIDVEKSMIVGCTCKEGWSHDGIPEAICTQRKTEKHAVPGEFCTCGFYALDEKIDHNLGQYQGDVYGEVYGWGRYVRGEEGWRAQYAYPKSFYIKQTTTPEQLDVLKKYHVPIFMQSPILMYNPEEDGYGHGNNEENWNSGTSKAPHSFEDTTEDDED